jgi:hypothetical protein
MSKPFVQWPALVDRCSLPVIRTDGSLTGYAGGLWRKNGFWNMRAQPKKKFILILML